MHPVLCGNRISCSSDAALYTGQGTDRNGGFLSEGYRHFLSSDRFLPDLPVCFKKCGKSKDKHTDKLHRSVSQCISKRSVYFRTVPCAKTRHPGCGARHGDRPGGGNTTLFRRLFPRADLQTGTFRHVRQAYTAASGFFKVLHPRAFE